MREWERAAKAAAEKERTRAGVKAARSTCLMSAIACVATCERARRTRNLAQEFDARERIEWKLKSEGAMLLAMRTRNVRRSLLRESELIDNEKSTNSNMASAL